MYVRQFLFNYFLFRHDSSFSILPVLNQPLKMLFLHPLNRKLIKNLYDNGIITNQPF